MAIPHGSPGQATCQKRRIRFFGRSERVEQWSSWWIMCSNSRKSWQVQAPSEKIAEKNLGEDWRMIEEWRMDGEWMINDRTGIMKWYLRRGVYNYGSLTSKSWDRTQKNILQVYGYQVPINHRKRKRYYWIRDLLRNHLVQWFRKITKMGT